MFLKAQTSEETAIRRREVKYGFKYGRACGQRIKPAGFFYEYRMKGNGGR
jgi:hypothetical protein